MPKKSDYILLISSLTLLTFAALFILRSADDNRLTSWQWVFEDVSVLKVYPILIAGVFISYLLSKIPAPGPYPALCLFILSFILAVPYWGAPEVIVDSSRYFTQAKHLEVYGIGYFLREWGRGIPAWTDLPLIPFLYGLIFKIFWESRIFIQIFTTALFSLTVVLAYLTGKLLWDKSTGFYGGALILGIPYLFSQIPLMLVDIPVMFFFSLSIFTFISALDKGGAMRIIFSSLAISASMLTKYSVWLMLTVLIVIFLVYLIKAFQPPSPSPPPVKGGGTGGDNPLIRGRITPVPLSRRIGIEWRTILFRGILILSVTALLIGVIFLYKSDVFLGQIRLLAAYQQPGLKRWGESFTSTFLFQIHPFITAAALYSAYAAFKKRDMRYLIAIFLPALVVLLQIRRIRYVMIVFPMLALTASYGLQQVRDEQLRKFIVLCIIVSSMTVSAFAYLPFLQNTSAVNLKSAGKFINSLDINKAEVFTKTDAWSPVNQAVSVPVFDLFTAKKISYHYSPGAVPPKDELSKSPFRFAWEYKNPAYYMDKATDGKTAVVVISENAGYQPDFAGKYRNYRVFRHSEGVFQHRTFVTVYYN
ncbi:MAG: glycosyltransferase family 39 protein [Nitrospirae bacterium]|nr:glycosyltransferase family 39 protein [Nitrospirota bacterium]